MPTMPEDIPILFPEIPLWSCKMSNVLAGAFRRCFERAYVSTELPGQTASNAVSRFEQLIDGKKPILSDDLSKMRRGKLIKIFLLPLVCLLTN